jgi:hypothetical protein
LSKLVPHTSGVEYYGVRVTESSVELWISLSVKLPLEELEGELVEHDGIRYMSFAGKKAQRARARARRRALWKALVAFVKRSDI